MCKTMFLREDFVLISSDVIATLNLQAAIEAHLLRRKKNKECLMTAVFREAPPGHHSRSARDDIMAAIDEETQQIVAYEPNCEATTLQIPTKILRNSTLALRLRNDLLDTRISICSAGLLQSFEDNFDYTLISQFVRGVVNEEILGAQVHAYVAKDKYAARVNCLRMYRAVTQDVINRWTFPLVPDYNITCQTSIRVSKFRIYKDQGVSLARSTIIGTQTLIGKDTIVDSNTSIQYSTIGCNCKIGKNVTISGSIIWDNVVIGDNVTITQSVIASYAHIGSNVTIPSGCLISFGVCVGAGISLSDFTKLSNCPEATTSLQLGEGGKGREYTCSTKVELGTEYVAQDWESEVKVEDEDQSQDEADVYESSFARFTKAIAVSVQNCCDDGVFAGEGTVGNLRAELTATKLAFDMDFLDLAYAIIITVLQLADPNNLTVFKANCRVWSSMLKKFLFDSDASSPTTELIFKLQEFAEEQNQYLKVFHVVLKSLMEANIINKMNITEWAEELKNDTDAESLLVQCSAFLSSLDKESDDLTESDEDEMLLWGAPSHKGKKSPQEGESEKSETSEKDSEADSLSYDDDSF
eukprot:TRINITY_DN8695_c0_g1_i1.p1 TRINITY_DN8695_c0_g1~~TRINITY_DN8695_c0_g1_i1.p1  ORF type:complete len:583 (-),score=109.60 TRINITY_DN8695_c0_g1_i1:42-1790(-)